MTDLQVNVEVDENDIKVTMPSTNFEVVYQKGEEAPGLMPKPWIQNDQHASVSAAEFLARAWEAAENRARELDWLKS